MAGFRATQARRFANTLRWSLAAGAAWAVALWGLLTGGA